jgi:hypothetical protein
MSHRPRDASSVRAIERFWRRRPFHDSVIREVTASNKRVIIRLDGFTLIITDVTDLRRCPVPATWLWESIALRPGGYSLDVETDEGHLTVAGLDFRLIRNSDLAVLIPPIDA